MSTAGDAAAHALHAQVVAAIAELRALRCTDVAATEALDAVKLAVHTLEQWWLPAIVTLLSTGP